MCPYFLFFFIPENFKCKETNREAKRDLLRDTHCTHLYLMNLFDIIMMLQICQNKYSLLVGVSYTCAGVNANVSHVFRISYKAVLLFDIAYPT